MKYWTILLATAALLFGFALAQKDTEEPATKKKKLVILTGDDLTHPSGTHEFKAGGALLKNAIAKSVLDSHIEVVHVHNWPEDTSVFEGAEMILHYYKGNRFHLLNRNAEFIDALAKQGVSQMFVHYACDPDTSVDNFIKSWTGGVYKDKYSSNPHWTLESQLEKHPINTGVENYTANDEWYMRIDFENDPVMGYDAPTVGSVHAVMAGENVDGKNGDMTKVHPRFKKAVKDGKKSNTVVFWAKEAENGCRGITVTGAHYHTTWTIESFRKQVLNSIAWGLKLPIPETGVTSPDITEDQLNENLDQSRKDFKRLKLN